MPNNDLIKRIDAVCAVYERIRQIGMEGNPYVLSIRQAVRDVPAADVEPKRKTGRWSVIGGKIRRDIDRRIVKCTLCHNNLSMEGVNCGRGDANYCPNCGAKMLPEPPKEEDNAE